jgi:hypothetical protein
MFKKYNAAIIYAAVLIMLTTVQGIVGCATKKTSAESTEQTKTVELVGKRDVSAEQTKVTDSNDREKEATEKEKIIERVRTVYFYPDSSGKQYVERYETEQIKEVALFGKQKESTTKESVITKQVQKDSVTVSVDEQTKEDVSLSNRKGGFFQNLGIIAGIILIIAVMIWLFKHYLNKKNR